MLIASLRNFATFASLRNLVEWSSLSVIFDENKSWHAMSVCSMPEREGNASWPSFWQLRKPNELIEALQRTSKLLESAGQSHSIKGRESINFNCFMSTSATWGFPQKQFVVWISDFMHHRVITQSSLLHDRHLFLGLGQSPQGLALRCTPRPTDATAHGWWLQYPTGQCFMPPSS